jgi:two-component system, NarL family, response regulator DevR
MIRLLLVDDHEMVRAGLRALLAMQEDIRIVGEAGTVADAIDAATRLAPDLVLMDLRLPDGSGIDACREILSQGTAKHVLFLTSYADERASISTVVAGASGYLLKDIGHQALVDAIRDAALGRPIVSAAIARAAAEELRNTHSLSKQEWRVMELVVEGRTNKQIAAALELSEKTIKNYLSNAFQKLGVERRTQAALAFTRVRGAQ